jgi:E3 ubiquitin-protein ligase KEG
VKEPPLASDLEVFQDNPGHLHRLVSEGDVSGVRSV